VIPLRVGVSVRVDILCKVESWKSWSRAGLPNFRVVKVRVRFLMQKYQKNWFHLIWLTNLILLLVMHHTLETAHNSIEMAHFSIQLERFSIETEHFSTEMAYIFTFLLRLSIY
jgi:hypothetical protein